MRVLERLLQKKEKTIIGLMSGTSADGIDAVIVDVAGNGITTKICQRAFETYSYPRGFKQCLLRHSDAKTARLDEIARLNVLIGMFFADSAKRIARKAGLRLSKVDLIGSHGQTVQHLPEKRLLFGKEIRATMQLGSPSVIAKLTGIVTVGDFRVGDVAKGGTGAPLVPYFDFIMFRSSRSNRALLNIGGIANITILPQKCALENVVAFDTGPGNMIIDGLMLHCFGKPFDKFGGVALRGRIIPELLRWLMSNPYLKKEPPKSTGREMFGEGLFKKILRHANRERREDIIATVSEYTALSVYDSYLRFVRRQTVLDEILLSGGGVHNQYIVDALQRYFDPIRVNPIEHLGFCSDAKEAICFAVLANEAIAGNPANVPAVTGARNETVLGTICLP